MENNKEDTNSRIDEIKERQREWMEEKEEKRRDKIKKIVSNNDPPIWYTLTDGHFNFRLMPGVKKSYSVYWQKKGEENWVHHPSWNVKPSGESGDLDHSDTLVGKVNKTVRKRLKYAKDYLNEDYTISTSNDVEDVMYAYYSAKKDDNIDYDGPTHEKKSLEILEREYVDHSVFVCTLEPDKHQFRIKYLDGEIPIQVSCSICDAPTERIS